jgi:3-mercaptopyruvate sulfurtransferase SseA
MFVHMRSLAAALIVLSSLPVAAKVAALGQATPPAAAPNEALAPRVALDEFKKLYDAGGVIVLDVRGAPTYRDGHIPGAVSAPLDTLSSRTASWQDGKKPVVAYCS